MHNLKTITALGGHEARVDSHGGATLRENDGLALASVHARLGQEAAVRKIMQGLLKAVAPQAAHAVMSDPFGAIWTGQDQWMVCAPFETHEELALQLAEEFAGSASVSEQTDAWAAFDLSGDGIDAVMELLCPLDLRTFKAGSATRTSIHHLGCFVQRLPAAQGFRIFAPRASAGSLHHAVLTAMRSAL